MLYYEVPLGSRNCHSQTAGQNCGSMNIMCVIRLHLTSDMVPSFLFRDDHLTIWHISPRIWPRKLNIEDWSGERYVWGESVPVNTGSAFLFGWVLRQFPCFVYLSNLLVGNCHRHEMQDQHPINHWLGWRVIQQGRYCLLMQAPRLLICPEYWHAIPALHDSVEWRSLPRNG